MMNNNDNNKMDIVEEKNYSYFERNKIPYSNHDTNQYIDWTANGTRITTDIAQLPVDVFGCAIKPLTRPLLDISTTADNVHYAWTVPPPPSATKLDEFGNPVDMFPNLSDRAKAEEYKKAIYAPPAWLSSAQVTNVQGMYTKLGNEDLMKKEIKYDLNKY